MGVFVRLEAYHTSIPDNRILNRSGLRSVMFHESCDRTHLVWSICEHARPFHDMGYEWPVSSCDRIRCFERFASTGCLRLLLNSDKCGQVCARASGHVDVNAYVEVFVNVHVSVHVHARLYVLVCEHECVHLNYHAHVHVRVHEHVHVHVHVHHAHVHAHASSYRHALLV